jgi:hypothetical protein
MKYGGYRLGTKWAHYAARFGADPKSEISKHFLNSNVVEPMSDNEKMKTFCSK